MTLAGLALLAVASGGSASAWDECAPRGPRRGACRTDHGHRCVPCAPCGSTVAWRRGYGRTYGTPWLVIRDRLDGRAYIRRSFLRGYFLRRYGVVFADGGHFAQPAEDGVGAWIDADGFGDAAQEPVDAIDRLNRGFARFHHGDYEGARADFGVVASTRSDLPAARVGRALTSMIAADWSAAARDLDALARSGELRAGDRLLVEEAFADPTRVTSLVDAAETWLRLRAGDRAAQLATGWLLGLLGEDDAARTHLERAADGAARRALLGAPQAPAGAAPAGGNDARPPAPPRLPRAIAEGEVARGA
ncbi:MAG: hypothetical protein AB7T63_05410 [Planctomycetota bacterium]